MFALETQERRPRSRAIVGHVFATPTGAPKRHDVLRVRVISLANGESPSRFLFLEAVGERGESIVQVATEHTRRDTWDHDYYATRSDARVRQAVRPLSATSLATSVNSECGPQSVLLYWPAPIRARDTLHERAAALGTVVLSRPERALLGAVIELLDDILPVAAGLTAPFASWLRHLRGHASLIAAMASREGE